MTLQEFLKCSMTADGVGAIVGFLLSFCAEWVPGFEALTPKAKRGVTLAFSLIIPVVALMSFELGFQGSWPGVEVIFLSVQAGFAFYYGSQASHMREL